MKICMVTDTYHPSFDGIVRYLDYLIPKLLEKGHQITVVCPWFKGEKSVDSPRAGLKIIRTSNSRIRSNAYYFAFPDLRLVKAIIESDFVVLHSLMPLGTFGGVIAKLFRKKIGFWCHHDERVILNDIMHFKPIIVSFLYKLIRKYYTKIVDVFFHATERFRRKLISFGAPSDRIVHTPFAINTRIFHPNPEINLRERFNLPSNAIIATYLGRLSVEKNVDNILQALDSAMDEHQNLYALVVGGGPDKEKFLAIERRNEDRFIFTGFIPENELQSHYAVSDIFVTPTLNESSCFTVFESMTCRVPVITSEKDHDPDIIHMENALLVQNVLDVNEIKNLILLLSSNEKFRKFLGYNGQKLISSRTWDNHSNRFMSALETQLLDRELIQTNKNRPEILEKTEKRLSRLKRVIGL
ncbi:MAG TPA: glycosyltransferase family 4 protein [candidate division Zixibacteria bacterium]|nr:glycosyltransferase family 4 protein [candidate division Zixibacteria bacterium]